MNAYGLMRDGYATLVKQGQITETEAKAEMRILDFLAECSADDICRLFDSSAFNGIVKAYTSMACDRAEISAEDKEKVELSLEQLFDKKTAKEALRFQR